MDTPTGQKAEFSFPYLDGTIKIVCEIDSNMSRKEKIIVIPSYDTRINRFTELRYGERDFVDDVKMMLKFLENSPNISSNLTVLSILIYLESQLSLYW